MPSQRMASAKPYADLEGVRPIEATRKDCSTSPTERAQHLCRFLLHERSRQLAALFLLLTKPTVQVSDFDHALISKQMKWNLTRAK